MPEALTDARWFLAAGVVLIAMALAGSVLRRLPLSSAMIYLAAGAALGPIGLGMIIVDPVGGAGLLEVVSEIAVIVSLFTAGCTVVLKPPSKDPLTMLTVAEVIESTGLPEGAVSILPMTRELGDRIVADDRFKPLTFTGSPGVGWRMKERAGKKRVVLELGSNAGVIVDASAKLVWAVARSVVGAFTYAGQVGIMTELRIMVLAPPL